MKTQIKQTIAKLSALAFVFALIVWVAPSQAAEDAEEAVEINAEVLLSLQLAVDENIVNIEVDPDVNSGSNLSGSTVVAGSSTTTTVNTNNQAGYKLQIKLAGKDTPGEAVLDGSGATNSTKIGSVSGATSVDNNFGFAYDDSGIAAVTEFKNDSTDIATSGLSTPTNGEDETIYYYLNVDYTIPADTYKGTVTYTAMALT